jgi:hypothetical protein
MDELTGCAQIGNEVEIEANHCERTLVSEDRERVKSLEKIYRECLKSSKPSTIFKHR